MKDLFISYGRRESLGFAARLHQKLKLAGFDAWFDKVNIPDSEDYAARINNGIESAHNFVYIMAPRSLCSPYCLIEIEYARVLGKRIIPINQMVIFQADDYELSDGDKRVLQSFYAFHGIEDPQIHSVQQVLDRSLAVVGRTDWLDGKEKLSDHDCDQLAAWAQAYENHWHKHDDLIYLQNLELPIFGENIDSLDSIIERMSTVLNRHQAYVKQHTEVLAHALNWQAQQNTTQYLLVGKERQAAEAWLLTHFKEGEQAPCEPGKLVCEFICEARKNAENRMTDCFVCYAAEDKAIRDEVIRGLARYAITTWRHDSDIDKGEDYAKAIDQGIENADNLLFFITPTAVKSTYCLKELDYAASLNKRIIPLLISPTPVADFPALIQPLQYIDFTKAHDIAATLNILHQEQAYYEQHKMLLARALKWERKQQKISFLLRGHNLENAKTWLRLNQDRPQHPPTKRHQTFIIASEAAKGRLGTDVFVSYSRKDGDFARRLNTALQEAGKTTWFDQESIASGVDFEKELYKGIDSADNFLFVLSPDAVTSKYCDDEVKYAEMQGKRILTVLCRETDPQTLPEALRIINWIDFLNQPFTPQLQELVQTIETDHEHVHQHTVLQQRAVEWTENQNSGDFLLNSNACTNAEHWQETAIEGEKQPVPTQIQQLYIEKSRAAIRKSHRRKNIMLVSALIGMVIAVFLAVLAFHHKQAADIHTIDALSAVSDANFSLENYFDALLQGLSAAQKLQNIQYMSAETKHDLSNKVMQSLQKNLYWVKESQRISIEKSQVVLSVAMDRMILASTKNSFDLYDFDGLFIANIHDTDGLKSPWVSDDAQFIFTTNNDEDKIMLWQADGQLYLDIHAPQGLLQNSLRYKATTQHLAFMSKDNHLNLWQLDKKLPLTLPAAMGSIKSFEFSYDGAYLVMLSTDNRLKIWDLKTKHLQVLEAVNVDAIAVSQRSGLIATRSQTQVSLWNLKAEPIAVLEDDTLTSVDFNPKSVHGKFPDAVEVIVTLTTDKTLKLWDVTGQLIETLNDDFGFTSVSFSPKGHIIRSQSLDKSYKFWRLNGAFIIDNPLPELAYNYNETVIATQAPDDSSTLQLWQIDGQLMSQFETYQNRIREVAFFQGLPFLATAGLNNLIKIWQTDGTLKATLKGHGDWLSLLKFNNRKGLLVSVSHDNTLKSWLANNRMKELSVNKVMFGTKQAEGQYQDFVQSFATATKEGSVKLWKAEGTMQEIKTLMKSANGQIDIQYSNNSGVLLTHKQASTHPITYTSPLNLWNAENGEFIQTLIPENPDHKRVISYFLEQDKRLLTLIQGEKSDVALQLWDTRNGALLKTLIAAQPSADGSRIRLIIADSGKGFISEISSDTHYGPVTIWNSQGEHRHLIDRIEQADLSADIHLSDDGTRALTMLKGEDFYGPIQAWGQDGKLIQTLLAKTPKPSHDTLRLDAAFANHSSAWVSSLAGVVDKQHLAGPIVLVNADGQSLTLAAQKQSDKAIKNYLEFSPNGQMLLTAISGEAVKLWQTDGQAINTLCDHSQGAIHLAFNHQQNMVAASYGDEAIRLWHKTDGSISTLAGSDTPKDEIKFSPDDSLLVVKNNKTALLIDLQTKAVATLKHQGQILRINFSPDNQSLVTSSFDKTAKLWRRDGTPLGTLGGHIARIDKAHFNQNGHQLLTADRDGKVIQWQLEGMNDLEGLQKQGCEWMKNYFNSLQGKKYQSICADVPIPSAME